MSTIELSGERLTARYHLLGDEAEARAKAEALCVEQTVEFPADLLPKGDIPDHIVGRLEGLRQLSKPAGDEVAVATGSCFEAEISFAMEIAGGELTQLLNVLFGNISLLSGFRLMGLELPPSLLGRFGGPRFGPAGLRALLDAPHRPLLCTALKPMGLSPRELAELARSFVLGGVDFIKDDHGLADQPFCRFEPRVEQVARAVAQANAESGGRCLYLPNVTAPSDRLSQRVAFAKQAGAGGLLICPGLIGLDSMRSIAEDDAVALPIISHPALQGSMVVSADQGIGHQVFAQLLRLAGADACIFPNLGGRFSWSAAECRALVHGCQTPMAALRPSFPVPAGGMRLDRVAEMVAFYGREVILLIGGNLHRQPEGLIEACRRLRRIAIEAANTE